jgi:hypothetical protein
MDSIKPQSRITPNQTGIDLAIENINNLLIQLSWLDHTFGIAKRSKEIIGGNEVVYPEVYAKDGRYTNLMTNRDYKTFSFVQLNDPFSSFDFDSNERDYLKQYNISIIFQVNLKYIDSSKNYVFTNELINNVLQKLQNVSDLKFVNGYKEFDNVWASYSLNQADSQAMKYPYDSFKLDFELKIIEPC